MTANAAALGLPELSGSRCKYTLHNGYHASAEARRCLDASSHIRGMPSTAKINIFKMIQRHAAVAAERRPAPAA